MLPFYPAFLAGMTLVPLADDAYAFLVAWEFMSLASWALVMAHHREPENARAGFVYIVMASFGGFALLLAFGLLAGAAGGLCVRRHARAHRLAAGVAAVALALALIGAGSKAGLVAVACLAAARPSGRAEPRLGADERRDDQSRGLRLHPHRLRSRSARPTGAGACRCSALGAATALLGVLQR